jgi:hypothetical protein
MFLGIFGSEFLAFCSQMKARNGWRRAMKQHPAAGYLLRAAYCYCARIGRNWMQLAGKKTAVARAVAINAGC